MWVFSDGRPLFYSDNAEQIVARVAEYFVSRYPEYNVDDVIRCFVADTWYYQNNQKHVNYTLRVSTRTDYICYVIYDISSVEHYIDSNYAYHSLFDEEPPD